MKVIETAWQDYKEKIIPRGASMAQIRETKKAFYAGAASLISSLLSVLGPDHEPTESDLLIMDGIKEELDQFVQNVQDSKE